MVTRDFQGERSKGSAGMALSKDYWVRPSCLAKGFVTQVHSGTGEWDRQRLCDHVGHSTDSAAGILRQRQLSILRGNQGVWSWITSLSQSTARVTTGKDQTLCSAAEKGLPIIPICYGVLVARECRKSQRTSTSPPRDRAGQAHEKGNKNTPNAESWLWGCCGKR